MTYYKTGTYKNIFICLLIILLFSITGCSQSISSHSTKEEITTETESASSVIEKHMNTCEITIPGISRDYHLLFLTDTHITIPSDSDSEQEHAYCTERLDHFTADSGYVASELFTAWIDYANEQKPDALLLGGDIIDCPTAGNMQFLDTSLHALNIPYIYTPGNHDWTFPWDYMTESGKTQYLAQLSPYMEQNTAIHSLEFDDFIIAAIDNSSNQIDSNALTEYKNLLAQGKPIIVMLHVPLYTEELLAKTSKVWNSSVVLSGGIHGGIYPNDVSTEFISLTTAENSPVVAILAGHVHLADQSAFSSQPDILQITGDAGYRGKSTLIHITPDSKK